MSKAVRDLGDELPMAFGTLASPSADCNRDTDAKSGSNQLLQHLWKAS